MCRDMRMDVCVDVPIDMRIDMCVDVWMDMCVDVYEPALVAPEAQTQPSQIGRTYIRHNYMGHNYMGHNYICHNYIQLSSLQKQKLNPLKPGVFANAWRSFDPHAVLLLPYAVGGMAQSSWIRIMGFFIICIAIVRVIVIESLQYSL